MSEIEFDVGGFHYRTRDMDARRQFHITAKLTAVMGALGDGSNPFGMLSALSPDDADFVINECLRVVDRQNDGGTGWSPVMSPQGLIMFDEIKTSMAVMIQLVIPVIQENAQSFFRELPKGYLGGVLANLAKASSTSA